MSKGNGAKDPTPVRSMTQMNMRVEEHVADTFRVFCQKQNLTQNAAMQVLLSADDDSRAEVIRSLQKENAALNEVIRELKENNKQIQSDNYHQKLILFKQRKDWIFVMRQIMNFFMKNQDEDQDDKERENLKAVSFKFAKENLSFKSFVYPSECGCEIICLEHLVYGKGIAPPVFVLGYTKNQERIKLRWYPKKEFIGISPKNRFFAEKNSEWLMGYLSAGDGAMDLAVAIPLEIIDAYGGKRHIANRNIPSLDEMLANAQKRAYENSTQF